MNFSTVFIKRPVLATVLSLLVLLLGVQGFLSMSIRQYPFVQESVVQITTAYPGASPDLIAGFISTPIAQAVSSTENVDFVTATSAQSISNVTVRMRLGSDPDKALAEVNSKLQQVRRQLPVDAEDPIIQKGTGRGIALFYLAFTSTNMSRPALTEYITRVVQPRLATLPGVADAQILGAQNYSMRIWLDPLLMASRGVTAVDISSAIRTNNFLSAPGKTQNELSAFSIDTNTTLKTPEAFGNLPLRGSGDNIVRLRDVAHIELGSSNLDVRTIIDGKEGVFIGISPTPDANPLDVGKEVRALVPQISRELPQGTQAIVAYDATVFIQSSISEVFKTIAEAVLIVIAVIFLFLGSLRTVLVPVVTIPLCLIGVCFFLFAMGYSINLLTLLAMVLAIGLVVDDAIVVVENIHRHIEQGVAPMQAAIEGMREIIGPVIAMSITLAAVFAPIGFTTGLTGALFREFAFTLAGAVLISGLLALTLSPMMSARLLHAHGAKISKIEERIEATFKSIQERYGRLLHEALDARGYILAAVGVILATTGFLFLNTKSELAPAEDQGGLFAQVQGPRYATADYTEAYVRQLPKLVGDIPETDRQFAIVGAGGANSAFTIWRFKPWDERSRSTKDIQPQIQSGLSKSAGLEAFVFNPSSLPGAGGGLPVQYVIRSLGQPDEVYRVAQEIRQRAMQSGKVAFVQNSLNFDLPRASILVDRDRAAALGIPISDIGTTLGVLLSNGRVSRFDLQNRSYDVIPQVPQEDRANPESLGRYYVRNQSGAMIPLSAVTKVSTYAGPVSIEQFNQLNSATLGAQPLPGVSADEALKTIQGIAAEVMPAGFFEDFVGESRLSRQEGNSLTRAFILAILVIYLVLAAQYESFRDPFIIMMAVPLSIFGALIPLNLGFATLNIYTRIGLITLVGLIVKHGILMVEFANDRRKLGGASRREAIEEAARVRLRPILMTTAAMVLGVVPLIIATGAGAAARFSIGIVIASGMAIGTLFTLFVVPAFYTFISHPDVVPARAPVPAPAVVPHPIASARAKKRVRGEKVDQ